MQTQAPLARLAYWSEFERDKDFYMPVKVTRWKYLVGVKSYLYDATLDMRNVEWFLLTLWRNSRYRFLKRRDKILLGHVIMANSIYKQSL